MPFGLAPTPKGTAAFSGVSHARSVELGQMEAGWLNSKSRDRTTVGVAPAKKPWCLSRGHFPILSTDPSFQKTIKTPGKQLVFEKNDG